jgi:hypothetical protein
MADRVDDSELSDRRSISGIPYNWDLWLNGDTWKAVRGKDYECKDASFRSAVKSAAQTRGLSFKASIHEGYVIFRATKKDGG